MKNAQSVHWLALVASLATHSATPRMRLWRAVKAGGCAVLRDGVYLLPRCEGAEKLFGELAQDVEESGGTAYQLGIAARDEAQETAFRALFDRTTQYAELAGEIAGTQAALPPAETPALRKAMKNLRRDFTALAAIDFFPGAAREQVESALGELEGAVQARFSPGEPQPAAGEIARRDPLDYRGRVWATRRHLWVDRMASAWLIRRFIDPQARFVWLESPADCPPEALGFDFDGAAFTHVGNRVTFEVLAASFALGADPALAKLAALVHFLDAGGIPVADAAGVETLLAGLRNRCADDDELLAEASRLFDLLYTAYAE
ncbi:MAG: chromate resistance protein [Sulfuricella sp.]|nr:chromate resistance protein [Sulfuricella sp.]